MQSNNNNQQATSLPLDPSRSFTWEKDPILDACVVQAEYGELLLLTDSGSLHGFDLDTGASRLLSTVDLPHMAPYEDDGSVFGAPAYRLHVSSDGRYAAIVVDQGRSGLVVEVSSGLATLRLDGGDYYEETVPFSACFLRFEGRDVLVHRTAWNRLDVSDPVTGRLLTDRHIAPYEAVGNRPEHYLDYFHGQLRPSPNGSRLFDDGWVWQPVSIPRVWSVTDWLKSNPWESEDGASIVDLTMRDDWTTPACWITETHLALWGLADWDEDEFEETGRGSGVRILDVTERKQSSSGRWPMALGDAKVQDLFSDGARLYVAAEVGTTVWDLASRAQVAELPGFVARLLDRVRGRLVAFGPDSISVVRLQAAASDALR
jgi:hypothetical protein